MTHRRHSLGRRVAGFRPATRGLSAIATNGSSRQPSTVGKPPSGLGDDYLARRHTAWSVAEAGLGVVSFNSSPERLTALFTSAPSTFGKRAPSMWVVSVLSASLTNQVPKLATSPIAAALYSSAGSAGRSPELNLGRPRAAVIVAYRPLASKIRIPLGLESVHWGCLVPSRVTSHDTSVQVPTSCSLRDFC